MCRSFVPHKAAWRLVSIVAYALVPLHETSAVPCGFGGGGAAP